MSVHEDDPAPTNSKWWICAILSPLIALASGIAVAACLGQRQDDWLGMRAAVPIMFALLGGCVLSCVFAVVSFEKRERHATYAFIAAIPSGLFVAFAVLGMFGVLK